MRALRQIDNFHFRGLGDKITLGVRRHTHTQKQTYTYTNKYYILSIFYVNCGKLFTPLMRKLIEAAKYTGPVNQPHGQAAVFDATNPFHA